MIRSLTLGGVVTILFVSGVLIWRTAAHAAPQSIPTARVERGSVQVTVYTTGELRAARTAQLAVPPMGGQLQIVGLAESGQAVKAGDAVVEFDPAEQAFALEQARFDLAQAEEEIVKADAAAAVQAAEDEVALLHARYDVRRAELDASTNELIGAISAKQNLLLLEEARHQLQQAQTDAAMHVGTNRASLGVSKEKKNKAALAVQVAERNIEMLKIRAPFDGFVTLRQNFQAFGGIYFGGAMPEYRVGDAAFSGQPIADVIDTARVEVTAKLSEQDRANVEAGQAVQVAIDALPGRPLRGTVRAVSGVASRQLFDAGTRQFDIAFDLTDPSRAHPGLTAGIAIAGPTLDNVLYVPRAAVFDVSGKPTVYTRAQGGFEPHEVRIKALTEALAVIDSLPKGTEVALVSPLTRGGSRAPAGPAPVTQRAAR
jgi:membrane fusion protein (multidrug efflux system)